MSDCIFCQIANGEADATIVYQDAFVVAFLDNKPISDGHTIVIPKRHVPDMEALDHEALFSMASVVKAVGGALIKGFGVKGYSVLLDNKSVANQHVPHVHFHIVPRVEGDGLDRWPQRDGYEGNEAIICAERIKSAL